MATYDTIYGTRGRYVGVVGAKESFDFTGQVSERLVDCCETLRGPYPVTAYSINGW